MLALAATSSAQEDSYAERALDGDRRLVVNCFDGEYLHADPFKRLD